MAATSSAPHPRLHSIEAALPEPAIPVEEQGCLAEGLGVEPGRPKLCGPPTADQPGPLEHLEVLGDRLDADRERRGELCHRGLALGEASEDGAACRIGEGREG
jgi:hypothetical protein